MSFSKQISQMTFSKLKKYEKQLKREHKRNQSEFVPNSAKLAGDVSQEQYIPVQNAKIAIKLKIHKDQ